MPTTATASVPDSTDVPVLPALPARLVEMLPGVARETLATVICGEIAARFDCPSSYLRVLRALITHVGWHGNRVWASYLRLATLAGAAKAICVKTVQRAIRYFVRTIGLRILCDRGELLRGPGEHAYVQAGNRKQSEYAVNHYDLSALRAFVPRDLIPAREPLPVPAVSPSPPPPFIQTQHACPVFGYEEGEGKPEKAPRNAARPKKFERTNLSAVSIKETDKEVDQGTKGHRALALAGVSVGMRRAILAARGELWAHQAALYTRLQNERGEIQTTPARYLVAVFKTWEAEKVARVQTCWPDWLQARWEREQAAEARVIRVEASAGVAQARQTVRAPASAAAPAAVVALPENTDAARAALRRSLPGAPAALIERLLARRPAGDTKGTL